MRTVAEAAPGFPKKKPPTILSLKRKVVGQLVKGASTLRYLEVVLDASFVAIKGTTPTSPEIDDIYNQIWKLCERINKL